MILNQLIQISLFTVVKNLETKRLVKERNRNYLCIKSQLSNAQKMTDVISKGNLTITFNYPLQFLPEVGVIAKTIIQTYVVGQIVNVELPMQPNGYLGGHYVLGHVDATAEVFNIDATPTAWFLNILVPEQLMKYAVYKGSIAINGVSLTINEVKDQTIELCIIPATLDKTNINQLSIGAKVNIEFDILAKYTEQLLLKRNV